MLPWEQSFILVVTEGGRASGLLFVCWVLSFRRPVGLALGWFALGLSDSTLFGTHVSY